MLIFKH